MSECYGVTILSSKLRGNLTSTSSSLVVTLNGLMEMSPSLSGGSPAPHQPSSVFRTWFLLLWTRKKISPPITIATSSSVNMVLSVCTGTGTCRGKMETEQGRVEHMKQGKIKNICQQTIYMAKTLLKLHNITIQRWDFWSKKSLLLHKVKSYYRTLWFHL